MSSNTIAKSATIQGKGKKKGAKFHTLPGVEATEANLPWCIDFNAKGGRHAVAQKDLPAGTLVMVEHPFLAVPMAKFASVVCHHCLRPLSQQATGASSGGNPCLPRYCPKCKESPNDVDPKLATLRIKLPDIATQHNLDPTMLHIITLLDLQRSKIDIGTLASSPEEDSTDAEVAPLPEVRCTVTDFDSMVNYWDRKSEAWRKKVGPAVRALHKELTALADAGTIPGYIPSPITRFQADAAAMSMNIQTISLAQGSSPDTGVGIFPALSLFQQSCVPNAFFITLGNSLFVRTILEVPKGTALTVNYTGLTDPRAQRQAVLEAERHASCTCARCIQPLETSIDRLLEGVMCPMCGVEVMVSLSSGPANDAAMEQYKTQLIHMKEERSKAAAKAAAKRKGSKGSRRDGKDGDTPVVEEDDPNELPAGLTFWKCCGCGFVEPACNTQLTGPTDVMTKAVHNLRQGVGFLSIKHPELVAQGETFLEELAGGMDGRLPIYNSRVLEALAPLIQVNLRKGEAIKVMNYALQLWDVERSLVEGRPTIQQLQCLEAMVDAAEHKAANTSSSVVKRQFGKRLKQAMDQLKETRMVLLGRS